MLDTDAPKGEQGRRMMLRRLRTYLGWKAELHSTSQNLGNASSTRAGGSVQKPGMASVSGDGELSEAMKKKDRDRRDRAASRRRVRGGAPAASSTSQRPNDSDQEGVMRRGGPLMEEAEQIADLSVFALLEVPMPCF